jgi:hypothetical protein
VASFSWSTWICRKRFLGVMLAVTFVDNLIRLRYIYVFIRSLLDF